MLDLMRKKAGTWMVKLILAAIIIVFTFWGVGSWTAQKGKRVATINGEPVTVEAYRQAYKRLMEQLRQQFGNNLSEDLLKMLNVEQQALDQVIDQRLLLNESRRLKFDVSSQELVTAIASYPGFQVDGVFNRRRYEAMLANNRMTPESFETTQKTSMLIDKVRRFVTGNAKVSDLEAREWYNWRNYSVNVVFALFSLEDFGAPGPDEKQALTFFDENKDSYKTAPMIKAEYIFFDPVAQAQNVTVSQADILDYYDEHTGEFNVPKTIQARHILIKTGQEASTDEIEKARLRAVNVAQLAAGGEDFAKLAKQYSEGPSSASGGDLGFFKREEMVKPFSDTAFAMAIGDISDPVRTRFGWHVIKVEKIQAPSIKTPDQVSEQIRKRLTDSGSKNLAYNLADRIYEESYAENSFIKSAEAQGLTVVTTDFFDTAGSPKGVVSGAVFAEAAFKLAENEVSDIVDAGNGFYLLKVIKKKPAGIPDIASVREQVNADWRRHEEEKRAMNAAGAFLDVMRDNASDWGPVAEKAGAKIGETGYFKKTEAIPQIGRSNQIAGIAFELTREKPLPDAPVKSEKGIYVIRFKDGKLPDKEGFDKEKSAIQTALIGQKKRELFLTLVSTLRSNSEIVIEDRYKN